MEGMLPGAFGDLIQGRHDDSLNGEVPKPLASALPLAPAPHSHQTHLGGGAVRQIYSNLKNDSL